jgi:hypothetical protein
MDSWWKQLPYLVDAYLAWRSTGMPSTPGSETYEANAASMSLNYPSTQAGKSQYLTLIMSVKHHGGLYAYCYDANIFTSTKCKIYK